MIEATQYPMAFDDLEKGSIISADEVERITGFTRCQTAHGMAVMKLVNQIVERLEERELYVMVRQEKGALHILDDPNGSAHAYCEFLRHARGCGRNIRRMGKVDVSKLSGSESRDHENRLMVAVSGYAGLRKGMSRARLELKNPPVVPGLPTAK